MDRKYLMPIAVGVLILVLLLVSGTLFFNGSEEGAGAVAVAAAGAALLARQRRQEAAVELEVMGQALEADAADLDAVLEKMREDAKANEAAVAKTSLGDLVDEENKRQT